MIIIVPVLCALAGLAVPDAPPQPARSSSLNPITVEIGQSGRDRGGLLDLLIPFSDRDILPTERALADSLVGRQWIDLTDENPEVAVAVRWQQRSRGSQSRSRDGKNTTITFTYKVSAAIATRREKDDIDAEAMVTKTYSSNSSRMEPSRSDDREGFQRAGKELGTKVRTWLLSRIESLRPDGPDPGFRHQIKHKLLIIGDGLEVTEVNPDSPAGLAGLRQGDRIRKVDGEGGTSQMDERVLTLRIETGAIPLRVEFERDKKRQTIAFEVAPPRSRERTPKKSPDRP